MDAEALFQKLEKAVLDHPRLTLVPPPMGEPSLYLDRQGHHATIPFYFKSYGIARMYRLSGSGASYEEAVEQAAASVNGWVEEYDRVTGG